MTTIPASAIVDVTPSVLAAGGDALDLVGLLLTTSTRVPIGTVESFANAAAVSSFFGPTSDEFNIATEYFNGFDNSLSKPGSVLFAQYPTTAVSAYLQGGNISGLSLTQLQALSGQLGVVIDGVQKTASISLAAATSFSNAASIIGQALGITGTLAGSGVGSIAGGTMTVSSLGSGTVGATDVVSGTGVTANTYVTGQLSGTVGGVGTYGVTPTQNALSEPLNFFNPAVVYDSISGGFIIRSGTTGASSTITFGSGPLATSLSLTQTLGAVTSQGAIAATPIAFMTALTQITQNWATFMTLFNPDAAGFANKLLFAQWTNSTNQRYMYVVWDLDLSPSVSNPASASFGQAIIAANYSGTCPVGQDGTGGSPRDICAFVCGAVASIDFAAVNGRTTLAFRSQTGLLATVTSQTAANNLDANGYNYYGAFATANEQFVFFYPGSVSGPFLWIDSYINQIWLNNNFQLALMNLLTTAFSIPYNAAGKTQITAALADPINAGLLFGAFRAGITLSAAQKSAVNASAGLDIANTLQNVGWYLSVGDATPQVRAARGSPPCTFWYVDGQSIQQIDLASIEVQ